MYFSKVLMQFFENQTVRFLFSGGMTACLYFGLTYVLLTLGTTSWLSALLAYLIAFSVGYTAHKIFTFQSTSSHSVSLPRYAALQIGCAAIAAVSASGAELFGLRQPSLISLLSTIVLGAASYLVTSKWVFSNDKKPQQSI
jgi:putative flippase GtrA